MKALGLDIIPAMSTVSENVVASAKSPEEWISASA